MNTAEKIQHAINAINIAVKDLNFHYSVTTDKGFKLTKHTVNNATLQTDIKPFITLQDMYIHVWELLGLYCPGAVRPAGKSPIIPRIKALLALGFDFDIEADIFHYNGWKLTTGVDVEQMDGPQWDATLTRAKERVNAIV